MKTLLQRLADSMVLGALLDSIRGELGSYELLDHWQQGEFHHDVVLRVPQHVGLPGTVLVVSTNCNGGIKEVLCLAEVPECYEGIGEAPVGTDARQSR